jgi:hypothetical protein
MPWGCPRSLRQTAQASARVAPNTGVIAGKPLAKSVKIIESEFLESIADNRVGYNLNLSTIGWIDDCNLLYFQNLTVNKIVTFRKCLFSSIL